MNCNTNANFSVPNKSSLCQKLFLINIAVWVTCKAEGQGNKYGSGDGTVQSCVFPFKSDGRTHYGCAKSSYPKQDPWCATKVDSKGNFKKTDWARCNDYCPVWQKLDCKFYLVVPEKKNYNDAKAHCLSIAAKLALAEPKDKKVSAFVKRIAGEKDISDFWVDSHDKKVTGKKAFICEKADNGRSHRSDFEIVDHKHEQAQDLNFHF